jgi:hypothetical protein
MFFHHFFYPSLTPTGTEATYVPYVSWETNCFQEHLSRSAIATVDCVSIFRHRRLALAVGLHSESARQGRRRKQNGQQLFATIQTVPTERARETDRTSVTLAERPDGQPAALVTWFYPGIDTGHEFLYSKQEEKELTQDAKQIFVGDRGLMVSSGTSAAGN